MTLPSRSTTGRSPSVTEPYSTPDGVIQTLASPRRTDMFPAVPSMRPASIIRLAYATISAFMEDLRIDDIINRIPSQQLRDRGSHHGRLPLLSIECRPAYMGCNDEATRITQSGHRGVPSGRRMVERGHGQLIALERTDQRGAIVDLRPRRVYIDCSGLHQ